MTESTTGDHAVQVYRLRVARGNQAGSGGGGDWRLYESRADFEAATFNALIEAAAHGRTETTVTKRRARAWLVDLMRGGKDVETKEWTTSKVYAAEKLVDGQWVDMGARLIPPSIVFDAEPGDV